MSGSIATATTASRPDTAARDACVEVIGLCGAGKTTVLSRLLAALDRAPCDPRPRIDTPVVPGGPAALLAAARVVACASRRDAGAVARFLARPGAWWLPLKLGYRLAGFRLRTGAGPRLLVDSGVLQPFVSFEVERNVHGRDVPLDALLAAIDWPDAVLLVDVGAATARERWIARESAAGRARSLDRIEARFETATRRCDELVARCRARGVPVARLDLEAEPSDEALGSAARFVAEPRGAAVRG